MFDWIRHFVSAIFFCVWSAQISIWVVWLWDGMNLERHHMFSHMLLAPTEPIFKVENNQRMSAMTSHIYLYKSWRKNNWEGEYKHTSLKDKILNIYICIYIYLIFVYFGNNPSFIEEDKLGASHESFIYLFTYSCALAGCNARSIFKQSSTGLSWDFLLLYHSKFKGLSLPYYLSIAGTFLEGIRALGLELGLLCPFLLMVTIIPWATLSTV